MIPSRHNQLYVHDGIDYIFNSRTNIFHQIAVTFQQLKSVQFRPTEKSKMVFIADKLYLLGGNKNRSYLYHDEYTTDIWECHYNKEYLWKLSDLKLPTEISFMCAWNCIVAFKNVLIICQWIQNKGLTRWYLDMKDIENGWIGDKIEMKKDKWMLPMWQWAAHCVLTPDNVVHWFFIHSFEDNYYNPIYHKAMILTSLIPREICWKYCSALIFGYIHDIEKEMDLLYDIPQEIVRMILLYFI